MHILTFSASPRKLWLDTKNILNPSYWLLAALMAELANEETVYVVPESMTPVGRIRPYKGEPIEKIIIMGCAYSPGSMGASFNRDNPKHQRVFQIADVARRASARPAIPRTAAPTSRSRSLETVSN